MRQHTYYKKQMSTLYKDLSGLISSKETEDTKGILKIISRKQTDNAVSNTKNDKIPTALLNT